MPKSWFFDIHEDTPEQEAANLMEHSAAVLDISSDDDAETKRQNAALERGKENIPPPDFALPQTRAQHATTDAMQTSEQPADQPASHVKLPRLRNIAQDAMDEDRRPLSDLPAAAFYAEGCDAASYVTVDPGLEKPSGLSKEFDFSCPTPEKERPVEAVVEAAAPGVEAAVTVVDAAPEDQVAVFVDESVAQVPQGGDVSGAVAAGEQSEVSSETL